MTGQNLNFTVQKFKCSSAYLRNVIHTTAKLVSSKKMYTVYILSAKDLSALLTICFRSLLFVL